jgi:hypothetical protein
MTFLALAVIGIAHGQDPAPPKPRRMTPITAPGANIKVSRSDARLTILKMQKMLCADTGASDNGSKVAIPPGDAYVTRHEVIQEFGRLFTLYQPRFKFTPPKVKYDVAMLSVGAGDKPIVEKLIQWGFVAKQGPIASALTPTLTVHQFGDAVGFFVARTESLSSLPPSHWTPYLNGGRE